ncbi:hypothetical protein FACS1894198_0190 [Clostridia bacterium]|nr:hypothetical protein FACS1894198_0190 [Clostridia bacterium]
MKSKKTLAFICGVVVITGTVCTPIVTANKFTDEVDKVLVAVEAHMQKGDGETATFKGTEAEARQIIKEANRVATALREALQSGEIWDGKKPTTFAGANVHPIGVWADGARKRLAPLLLVSTRLVRNPPFSVFAAPLLFALSAVSQPLQDWFVEKKENDPTGLEEKQPEKQKQREENGEPQPPDFLFGATGKVRGDTIEFALPANANYLVFREPFSTGEASPSYSQGMRQMDRVSLVAPASTNGGQPLQNVSVNPAPTTDSSLSGSTSADSITPNSLSKSTDSTATNLALTNSTLSNSIF